MLVTCLNVIAMGGGSNLYPPEQFPSFTPVQIQERIKGSKIVIVSEQVLYPIFFQTQLTYPGNAQCHLHHQGVYALHVYTPDPASFTREDG